MTDLPAEPELPRAVALAWGVAANPQRGPKRELSIEGIVEVAVGLADRGGLAAVSMAAVAAELGFTPMSLYRYLTAKDDLLVLMEEEGIGLPPETVLEQDGWRARLSDWANAVGERYAEHPWLLDIPILGTPTTPNNLAWLDTALAALAETDISEDDKLSVVLAVIAQVRWRATIGRANQPAVDGAGPGGTNESDADAAAILDRLVTAEGLPFVRQAIDARGFEPRAGADPLSFGLERLLDGLESLLAVDPSKRPTAQQADPIEAQVDRDRSVREAVRSRREAEKSLREARKRERERRREARDRLRRMS